MSHFSTLVCLPKDSPLDELERLLSEVMEPWDENRRVDPYRRYEDGSPEEFWWVGGVRRGADHYRDGTGIKPHNPNMCASFSTAETRQTPEQQRAEFAEDARWAERLGEHPTWETIVSLYNEKYHPGAELAAVGDDSDSDRLHYDPESGRAYTITTYNPESKWDYWRIGGRWRDYFIAKSAAPGLISSEKQWDSPNSTTWAELRCCGGPIQHLDFDAMRVDEGRQESERYDAWERIVAQHGFPKGWEHFYGLAEVGELAWDEARRRYGAQPAIAAARDELDHWGCPVAEFLPPREEYVAEARRGAVPGYALVTLDREWMAPGRMGWFGMSTEGEGEKSAYRTAVNHYLDQLDPATILVVLDLHI